MGKSENKKGITSRYVGIIVTVVATVCFAAGGTLTYLQMRESKCHKSLQAGEKEIAELKVSIEALIKEKQDLRKQLENLPNPSQFLSGMIRKGAELAWNDKDIKLKSFDIVSRELRLTFSDSNDREIYRACRRRGELAPISGAKGRLNFKLTEIKPGNAVLGTSDQIEFEATYELFAKTEGTK